MGIFGFFSKKENKENLDQGLEKTKTSFFSKISKALVGKSRIDEEVLDAWTQEFHAQVGALMLERWNFPQWMGAAVRFHHDPYSAGEHVEHALTAQMADLLAHASTHPDPMADAALAQHPALADLDIYTDEFQALLERREKVLELAKAFQ